MGCNVGQWIKIILVLDDKWLPSLTHNAFYEGISRVRTGAGLCVIRLRNREEAVKDWRGRLKTLVPKVMVPLYMLKMSYDNVHNLLKTMYHEWHIDYDMRGHRKRVHCKKCNKAPKKGTFPCNKQCGCVFSTTHHRRLHEACCKHHASNAGQEDNVQDGSIVEPHSCGKRPINTPSPAARKKQSTGTHINNPGVRHVEDAIIDRVMQPAFDEDAFIHPVTKAQALLDEHGQQRVEQEGKPCVRDNEASATSPSKRRHRSSSSTPSSTCNFST